MSRATSSPTEDQERAALSARALDAGRRAGLAAVGITGPEPFTEARRALEERRAAGLHGGMGFTYRNPERSTDPAATLPTVRALIAGALAYGEGDEPPVRGHRPTGTVAKVARAAHYERLGEALEQVAGVLRGEGWRGVVMVDQNHLVDRAVAHRAGLGWFGRSSLLLVPGVGSWCVLGSVLTDAPLAPTADAPVPDGCGPCTRCVQACPTDAIVAPGVVDARRCLSWLVQAPGPLPRPVREAMGARVYGCDDCQDVCPPNRVVLRRGAEGGTVGEAEVDLLDLLAADDEALLARHGRWYIADRDPRWLRRNALVALGNVARPADPDVGRALTDALVGHDDLLAAHAAWAARRLGRTDLLDGLHPAPGSDLAAEVAAPAPTPRRGAA